MCNPGSNMPDKIKDKLIFTLKYIVGILLLVWILSRVDQESLLNTFLGLEFINIILLLIIAATNLTLQFRLWALLHGKFLTLHLSRHLLSRRQFPMLWCEYLNFLIKSLWWTSSNSRSPVSGSFDNPYSALRLVFLIYNELKGNATLLMSQTFFATFHDSLRNWW